MQTKIPQALGLDLAHTAGIEINNEIVAGINTALTEALIGLAGRKHYRTPVLVGAARSLFDAGQLQQVVALCAAANEFHPALIRLFGRTIRLGQGASTLAYIARAATFFSGTRWEDGRVQVYLRPGPVADQGMDRKDFDRAFYAFYLACLKEIVLGNAEDLAGGVIWQLLNQPMPSGKE